MHGKPIAVKKKLKTRHSYDTGKKYSLNHVKRVNKTIAITWAGKQPSLEKQIALLKSGLAP